MIRNRCRIGIAWGLLLALLAPAHAQRLANDSDGRTTTDVLPLVRVDEKGDEYLPKARQAIEREDYTEAIRILQSLIKRDSTGFARQPDDERYVSLRSTAQAMLAALPPEVLANYRREYDTEAGRHYRDAMASNRVEAFRRVAEQYRHTSYGPKALLSMGALQFDRRRFAEAARSWEEYRRHPLTEDTPLLLTKLAVARHLAGLTDAGTATAEELRTRFSQAEAELGGRQRLLTDYLDEVLQRPVPPRREMELLQKEYPGWGGSQTGLYAMPPCAVVLFPRWISPLHPSMDGLGRSDVIAEGVLPESEMRIRGRETPLEVWYRDGHLLVGTDPSETPNEAASAVPPAVRPVVARDVLVDSERGQRLDLLLYRRDDSVVAVDFHTGRTIWENDLLPMWRDSAGGGGYSRRYYGSGTLLTDTGRYGLTMGDGRVYTICKFQEASPPRRGETPDEEATGSYLAAMSLDKGLYIEWIAGLGWGENELVKQASYLSLPTYLPAQGDQPPRLYVVAMYLQNYHLVCFHAETGEFLWSSEISQKPAMQMYQFALFQDFARMGTPPVIGEGRVFVTTNAGVLAAFDTDTGQPLWARQYPTILSDSNSLWGRINRESLSHYETNPLVLMGDTIVALPPDSTQLLAFKAKDGSWAWTDSSGQPRTVAVEENLYLSALDAEHVLLSNPRIMIVRAADGAVVQRNGDDLDLVGRPAVTTEGILGCGLREVYHISPETAEVVETWPVQPGSLLGNLLSLDGKLIASNALGVCAFSRFEDAYEDFTLEIESLSEPVDVAGAYYQRGVLAFSVEKFDQALSDFQLALTLANEQKTPDEGLGPLRAQLRSRIMRTHIAQGNFAEDPAQRVEHFQAALTLAETPQETVHMLIRLAKLHEQNGNFRKAIDLAHRIGDEFSREQVVDVRIGPAADNRVYLDDTSVTLSARAWAHAPRRGFIPRLIAIHGREVYAAFDAKAKALLDQGLADNDPEILESIQRLYPHSLYSQEALFRMAELFFRQARATNDKQKHDALMARVQPYLNQIAGMHESDYWVSATVALVAIYHANDLTVSVQTTKATLKDVDPSTPVSFAEIQGPLGDVLEQIRTGEIQIHPGTERSILRLPQHELFSLPGDDLLILRDQQQAPILLGRLFVAQRGSQTLLIDALAADPASAIRKTIVSSVDAGRMTNAVMRRGVWRTPWGFSGVAGLSTEGDVVCVADEMHAMAFALHGTATAPLWDVSMESLKLERGIACLLFVEQDVLIAVDVNGKAVGVDLHSGEPRWIFHLAKIGVNVKCIAQAEAGRALFVLNEAKQLYVLDVETGKLCFRRQSEQPMQARLNSEGVLALCADSELQFRTGEFFEQVRPAGAVDPSQPYHLPYMNCDFLVLETSPDRRHRQRTVIPLDSPQTRTTLGAEDSSDSIVQVVSNALGTLTVLCGNSMLQPLESGVPVLPQMSLRRFSVSDGREKYGQSVPIRETKQGRLQQAYAVPGLVLVSMVEQRKAHCYILDMEKGRMQQTIDILAHGGGKRNVSAKRLCSASRSAVVAGRLVLETPEGLVIHAPE